MYVNVSVQHISIYACIQKRPQEYMEQIFSIAQRTDRKKMYALEN